MSDESDKLQALFIAPHQLRFGREGLDFDDGYRNERHAFQYTPMAQRQAMEVALLSEFRERGVRVLVVEADASGSQAQDDLLFNSKWHSAGRERRRSDTPGADICSHIVLKL